MADVTSSDVGADADVIVVGAGPAGATAAAHLAQAGVDVLLLEKAAFPREKVCGDGLTPRAVKQLLRLGIDTSEDAGWLRNKGLRILGAGHRLELRWPELATYPDYGLVRRRSDFDEMLARHAQKAGARLHERTTITGALLDERSGRVVGVRAKDPEGRPFEARAPLVVAADGNSSRLSLDVGRRVRDDRPMAVAVRAYYRSDRDRDEWLESWLELRAGQALLPGYGWVFGMGDGTSNVGLGILNTSSAFGKVDYRDVLRRWLDGTPEDLGLREETRVGPVRGAALPMAFNRKPHYADGLMLIGDAGGMVNPFNGEGIAYAMESAALAAEVLVQSLGRPVGPSRERALAAYPHALQQMWGGYFTLGRAFVRLIGEPKVMELATKHGLPRATLMRFTLKLLANLFDPRDGDASDRLISALAKVVPRA